MMKIILLVSGLVFIPTVFSQNDTCEKCCMKNVVRPVDTEKDGNRKGYFLCLQIPVTTVKIDVIISNLSLGDDKIHPNDCINNREDTSKHHFEIMNGGDDVFHCSGNSLNQPYNFSREISSNDKTLEFNLTVGRSTSEIVPWFEVYFNLTACSDEVGGVITRVKGPAFKINCTGGKEGVDSEDIYNCVDGVWELYGKVVTPNCTEPGTDVSTSTSQKYSAYTKNPDETCEYECEEKWEKRVKSLEIGLSVFGAVVVLGVVAVTVTVLCICHCRGKLQCNKKEETNSNTRQVVTDADRRDPAEHGLLSQSDHDDGEITTAAEQSTDLTEPPPNTRTPKSRSPLQIEESSQQAKKKCILQ